MTLLVDAGLIPEDLLDYFEPADNGGMADTWHIPTTPFSARSVGIDDLDHYAVMPPKLVEPCVLAGTSERGVCPTCGAPWVRVVKTSRATYAAVDDPTTHTGRRGMNRARPGPAETYVLREPQWALAERLREAARGREVEMRDRYGARWDHWTRTDKSGARVPTFQDAADLEIALGITIDFDGAAGGWRPSCACDAGEPVPATVLDPFCGAGTVGLVAIQHGRRFIGIDLNARYLEIARRRIEKAAPALPLLAMAAD